MTINPLVAARVEGPKDAWAGIWLAEDIELIHQGIQNGSWIDSSLGVVGAGLDALALLTDPVGTLLQYGISWIIEQVEPLSDALDWLAGDAAQIAAHAQTWRNVARRLDESVLDLRDAVRRDIIDWHGAAADAYRDWSSQQQQAVAALGRASEAMAAITEGAGYLIAAVRILVRDAIATVVSRLIVYIAELIATGGFGTPFVMEQVSTLVAAWCAKIARWLRSLLASLRRLLPVVEQLGGIIADLRRILNRLRGREPDLPGPGPPPPKIGGPRDFAPTDLRGLTPDQVRQRIPDNWIHEPSARGGGELFRDPANPGRQIRIMPGYPPGSRPDEVTWGPYVVVSQGGVKAKVPLDGNPTLP